MNYERRRFLQTLGVAIPAATVRANPRPAHRTRAAVNPLDPQLLRALGEAVLPSAVGPAGVARIVAAFQEWLEAFETDAEVLHGYGTETIQTAAPDPSVEWEAQLHALDAGARRTYQRPFAETALDDRQALVRDAIGAGDERIPPALGAGHVAVGLLAFFAASAEATNLAYRASIGRLACRPLDRVGIRPRQEDRDR